MQTTRDLEILQMCRLRNRWSPARMTLSGHNRHALKGIIKVSPTITTYLIASASDGEDTAKFSVMTSESKIQGFRERIDEPFPPRNVFFQYRFQLTLRKNLTFILQCGSASGNEQLHEEW